MERLSEFEKHVLINKGTERAFSGEYVYTKEDGLYRCKVCNAPLYRSSDKFDSHCGWPSFDDAIPGAIREIPDKDGIRTEIVCANCGAHLGHVFRGEGYTKKNTRHCVNSVSLTFDKKKNSNSEEAKAYFAGGCFWGVEYYMEQIKGVREVRSGFMGGSLKDPGYYDVVRGNTGHLETVEVIYDPAQVSFETLAKTFFEIHDPTQADGQGPDIGTQYLSAVFVNSDKERQTVNRLIGLLEKKGYKIATKVRDASPFYEAETYHQDYYKRKGSSPYCHRRVKRFD
ncbi:bifunctional methionine sulfoxide reductase B/A protein [Sulfurovum mangrovi]|nr:bifunctional methionine sulfoxide reductase B/A protein [Sulfurovum mangrovi]UFH60541.1 bifunctional methionine sulfoxide reductase B/A protein [Sulfurovum mangrovi]